MTALMVASAIGHVEAVRLLLARGADGNAEGYVSTCECTDVSVSLVFLSVCVLWCWFVCYYCQYNVYFS